MSSYKSNNNGFIRLEVSVEMEERAQQIRAERDEKYPNIFEEHDSDIRWVGELGEICVNDWIRSFGLTPHVDYHWMLEDPVGNPDFRIGSTTLDVKTTKRQVPPKYRLGYTAQITARHAKENCDYYFFCWYENEKRVMWFLGGITKKDFLCKAIYCPEGTQVHKYYQVRKGHEIYNIAIPKLLPCKDFAEEIGVARKVT